MKKVIGILIVLFIMTTISFGEDLTATVVDYDIYINGERILTEESQFPFLNYKNITYFPMTYDYTRALGVKSVFSYEEGLTITSTGDSEKLVQRFLGNQVKLGSQVKVKLFTMGDTITVNGNIIDNYKEDYPILMFKNMAYFPITWRFAKEEFDWTTHLGQEGFYIKSATKKYEPVLVSNPDDIYKAIVRFESWGYDSYDYDAIGYYIEGGRLVVPFDTVKFAEKIKITHYDGSVYDGEFHITQFDDKNDLAIICFDNWQKYFLNTFDGSPSEVNEHVYTLVDDKLNRHEVFNNYANAVLFPVNKNDASYGHPVFNEEYQVIGSMLFQNMDKTQNIVIKHNGFLETTKIYDPYFEEYIEPYSDILAAPRNVKAELLNNQAHITWDYSPMDYFKIYYAYDNEPYQELIFYTKNAWFYKEGGYYIDLPEGRDLTYYITAVKDGIESKYDSVNTLYNGYVNSSIIDDESYVKYLSDVYSVYKTSNYTIPISEYRVKGNFSKRKVYVFAYIDQDYLDEAMELIDNPIDRKEIEKLILGITDDIEVTMEKEISVFFVYNGITDTYDEELAKHNSAGKVYNELEDGTYQMFLPVLIVTSDYYGNKATISDWTTSEDLGNY